MADALDTLAARTPVTRDRYVDFLRAASIATVVVGHWLIGIVHWDHGLIRTTSAIGVTPGLWLATWVLQVMPIFFFVGGFSNLTAYEAFRRDGRTTWSFIRTRIERLLRPSLVFLVVWTVVQVVLHLADVGQPRGPVLWGETRLLRGMSPPAATVPFGPLWFLLVYLVVVVISPLTIRLNRWAGWWAPMAMVAGAVVVDVIGFGTGTRAIRFLNVAFTLLLPHQLGHLYADGRLGLLPRRAFWAMVAGGLTLLVILTNPPLFEWLGGDDRFRWFPTIGHYPKSSLGTDIEPISNAYPPTLVFLSVGIWTIGAAMLLRDRLSRWLQRARPWKAVILGNGMIMTLFLWHMTAFLLAILVLWPMGIGHRPGNTASYWIERPLWVAISGVFLTVIVLLVGRFERGRRSPA
ncbi:MAG TPA: acyltransferase [Actinomycetota bacterium]|nr:acyltransferase [Actinomycetota bacterium]